MKNRSPLVNITSGKKSAKKPLKNTVGRNPAKRRTRDYTPKN